MKTNSLSSVSKTMATCFYFLGKKIFYFENNEPEILLHRLYCHTHFTNAVKCCIVLHCIRYRKWIFNVIESDVQKGKASATALANMK